MSKNNTVDTSKTDSGVVKWRNRKTGTVYASVEFNGTPVATVTTEAGSVYNVDVVSLDAFTEPTSNTELDAQLMRMTKGAAGDIEDNTLEHCYIFNINDLTTLIAQREQAAELRGRIDELKHSMMKSSSFTNEEFELSRNMGVFYPSDLKRLEKLQATKPEKGGSER